MSHETTTDSTFNPSRPPDGSLCGLRRNRALARSGTERAIDSFIGRLTALHAQVVLLHILPTLLSRSPKNIPAQSNHGFGRTPLFLPQNPPIPISPIVSPSCNGNRILGRLGFSFSSFPLVRQDLVLFIPTSELANSYFCYCASFISQLVFGVKGLFG
ncbi:hypothetical protein BU23DRAFT_120914 [Bimuria novae-zelandiae CBS 107.79]|uniref:Uncharacterized protein n=1 Tax=Bimuria novae-zelandiae CBS 107.79 TaxID=1447943 RepID=A0A6A5VDE9_9PLEO|nr:hypothetical protein BU23DRAFT_120914 [Bimuria novae-zelandiae CBS 107.79]